MGEPRLTTLPLPETQGGSTSHPPLDRPGLSVFDGRPVAEDPEVACVDPGRLPLGSSEGGPRSPCVTVVVDGHDKS